MNEWSHTTAFVARSGPHPVVSGSNAAVCPIRPPTACTNTVDLAGTHTACLPATRANRYLSATVTFSKHLATSGTCDNTFIPSNPGSLCPASRTTSMALSSTVTPATHTVVSKYPTYGISNPSAARMLNQLRAERNRCP